MIKGDPDRDPKGLIYESYRIEGITAPECRSIFLDWALSLPDSSDTPTALRALLGQYEADHPDHPMNAVLREGLVTMATPKRRGGWRSRTRS
ncbi:hypothetical protein [Aestuariivita sp.]|jgi:hypothetical protein|uniref:hypothetical protein n=1 Tax=Aestuariivita sp. TaxID=1872407 RepID=UPI002170E3E7|nr:hypothetical protein [Aestuariivita sp.]MCE8008087.1 hypothetical protein [Aestuariivita sp.]